MPKSGELAIVLHTHMPYIEGGGVWPDPSNPPAGPDWNGFGTWPFGEEWLWEAIVTSYLPLVRMLDDAAARSADGRAPVTLSLTPVLCDQLEAPGAFARCVRFLREVRPVSHALDVEQMRTEGQPALAAELERGAAEYAAAAQLLEREPNLLGALGRHARWTSSASHAVLPLLATDHGIDLQVRTGVAAHRRRFTDWKGGFWLPECGYASHLDAPLRDAGVTAVCVELTNALGLGSARQLRPILTPGGLTVWPIDRATVALAWDQGGYPSSAAYRDTHRHTAHRHNAWRVDGAPYDRDAGLRQARADARDFVSRVRARVAGGGICVFAVDTELLGHWWYEGIDWLAAVIQEAERQGLPLTSLDDALTRHPPSRIKEPLPVSSWGEGGDLRTWSGVRVADLAFQARTSELQTMRSGHASGQRQLRELLALQSSDWAFLEWNRTAGDYPRQRAAGHAAALAHFSAADGDQEHPTVRSLAPALAPPAFR